MNRNFTRNLTKSLSFAFAVLLGSSAFGQNQMDLPVTFETATTNYSLIGFGGAEVSTIEADPLNAGNTVAKVIKSATAQTWAGTTVTDSAGLGFASAIPFASGSTSMSVKVLSPNASIQVRLKAENHTNPGISVETEATVTVAGQWTTLTFNFANQASGTAAINLANVYDKVSIFFNFGVDGATAGMKTYYFDDIMFVPGGPTLAQMDLPVTFENAGTNYSLIGFGGSENSTIVADPVVATNTVAKVIKSAGAQTWAGTTITDSTNSGLLNPIPFATGSTSMQLKVWSPDAGIPIRLKVEDHTNPGISVETEATTTMAGAWETLVFDFSNQATGTAAINLANSYNKASVFFNFGTDGATAGQKTYYFDDLDMLAMQPAGLNITIDVCSTTADTVRMTGPFWSWDPNAGPIAVDNGNGTWTVNLNPTPTADMEYLFIVDGVQENLVSDMQNGGTCAPVTDYFNYANRKWTVGDPDVIGIAYDRCVPCSYPDLVITTEICDSAAPTQVNLTGPLWGWNPAFGPQAVNNGNGTWTFTISPAPSDSLEYLLVKDGTMENLISAMVNGGTCAPLTDNSTYANRLWTLGQTATFTNTYGYCINCASLSLDDSDLEASSVYPNPVYTNVTITRNTKIEKVVIYSIIGEKVLEFDTNSNSVELNLEGLSQGVYQAVVYGGNKVSRTQLIKK